MHLLPIVKYKVGLHTVNIVWVCQRSFSIVIIHWCYIKFYKYNSAWHTFDILIKSLKIFKIKYCLLTFFNNWITAVELWKLWRRHFKYTLRISWFRTHVCHRLPAECWARQKQLLVCNGYRLRMSTLKGGCGERTRNIRKWSIW